MFMDILDHTADPVSSRPAPRFTAKQGQYLAFIHTYALLHREPPAEADFQRFFQVTPPTVHGMIVALERRGLAASHGSPGRSGWYWRQMSYPPSNRSKSLRRGTRGMV